jgi:hypothetical protein
MSRKRKAIDVKPIKATAGGFKSGQVYQSADAGTALRVFDSLGHGVVQVQRLGERTVETITEDDLLVSDDWYLVQAIH